MMRKSHNTYLFIIMMTCLVTALSTGVVWAGSLEPPASAMDANGNPVPTTIEALDRLLSRPIDDGDIRFIPVPPFMDRVVDARMGVEWERSPDSTLRTHADALTHCDQLRTDGFDDWRLPERDELVSLIDLSNSGGNPDLPPGHPFENVQSGIYWSATTIERQTGVLYVVFFDNGLVGNRPGFGNTSFEFFVWCVR